jgi:hypothetical protein
VTAPSALRAGDVLTRPSPVLQWEPAAVRSEGRDSGGKSVARRDVQTPAAPIPVIQRIVRRTFIDARERDGSFTGRMRVGGREEGPKRWSVTRLAIAAIVAVTLAAGLGGLAGFAMRAVTPEAATLAR